MSDLVFCSFNANIRFETFQNLQFPNFETIYQKY